MDAPFFTIAIPTYNRPNYLRQTLASALAQTFANFEIVIGNDYVAQPLTAGEMGIDDERVRIVNHATNHGELQNMRALLAEARGRYLFWLFDDDLIAPNMLAAVYQALSDHDFPPAVMPAFEVIRPHDGLRQGTDGDACAVALSGRDFLRRYWAGELPVMGHGGVFSAEYLRSFNGVDRLSKSPFAIYAEYLMLVRLGLLDKVAYIAAPLVYYRVHDGVQGSTAGELETIRQAGANLLAASVWRLAEGSLSADFTANTTALVKLLLREYRWKLKTSGVKQQRRALLGYMLHLRRALFMLKPAAVRRRTTRIIFTIGMKSLLPVQLARRMRRWRTTSGKRAGNSSTQQIAETVS